MRSHKTKAEDDEEEQREGGDLKTDECKDSNDNKGPPKLSRTDVVTVSHGDETSVSENVYEDMPIERSAEAVTYVYLNEFPRELRGQHIAVNGKDVTLKRFLVEYGKTLFEPLKGFSGAHDPVTVLDELADVRMKNTENGALIVVGKQVSAAYTALQGKQLPKDGTSRTKALLKELVKTAPHLADTLKAAHRSWYPTTSGQYKRYLLEMAKEFLGSEDDLSDGMTQNAETGMPTQEQDKKLCWELKQRKNEEGMNQSDSHGRRKYRNGEGEQPRIPEKNLPSEDAERPRSSYPDCGKSSHTVSSCWKKGGGACQEEQLPPSKKMKLQSSLKAQMAATTVTQSKFDRLCKLLEPLVKTQMDSARQ